MATREMPELSEDQFPSNSFTQKQKVNNRRKTASKPKKQKSDISSKPDDEFREKRVKTVAKAKAQKQSLIKKLGKSIIEDSIESVKEQAFNDIIVPGIKALLFDTITNMADAMIFGGTGYTQGYTARDRSHRRSDDRTSYSGFYEEKSRRNGSTASHRMTDYTLEPDDIIVDTRRQATNALNEVNKCIRKYGNASIADLYDAVELTSDWTDGKYGWYDIRGASIRPIRGGKYLIIMPPTVELD